MCIYLTIIFSVIIMAIVSEPVIFCNYGEYAGHSLLLVILSCYCLRYMGHWISRMHYTDVNMSEVFNSFPLLFCAGGTFTLAMLVCVLLSFQNGEADNDNPHH